jgi:hypothetical protein
VEQQAAVEQRVVVDQPYSMPTSLIATILVIGIVAFLVVNLWAADML